MKRVYADLHLCADCDRMEQFSRVVEKASKLGYGLIAVPFRKSSEEQIRHVRETCEKADVDFASRVNLRPRTPEELVLSLRKLRRRFEIVAVMCESKGVARQAAKDRRVDLLNFPQPDFRRSFFDAAEAELASNCLASLEVDVKPLLTLEGPARIRLISSLRREVATAREFHVPIVISSGISDEMLMRKPRELAALASLFDLSGVYSLEAVSKNPVALVKRNREKLGSKFVAPGIRLIRRGKDS
ncbi:MAG: RNase P subunit p30 family protein [Candidatus Bathyarchaeia archaeon]